ncbi:hypothetical protein AWB70_00525 [Caballeronia cordobensis]|uniref:Uncharacterized protein n=1 Tax=Caballeronia cordobensis TaxID=1353886 RepID=A0A158F3E5_CABCO|nr:hypothetical protein AWB70_00525 [Caballeronia cordobensis]
MLVYNWRPFVDEIYLLILERVILKINRIQVRKNERVDPLFSRFHVIDKIRYVILNSREIPVIEIIKNFVNYDDAIALTYFALDPLNHCRECQ